MNKVGLKVRFVRGYTSVKNVMLYYHISPKSLLLQDPPPLPLVETVTKIQRIMYSKGVCQKLHAELCIGALCIRALIQHSW